MFVSVRLGAGGLIIVLALLVMDDALIKTEEKGEGGVRCGVL